MVLVIVLNHREEVRVCSQVMQHHGNLICDQSPLWDTSNCAVRVNFNPFAVRQLQPKHQNVRN